MTTKRTPTSVSASPVTATSKLLTALDQHIAEHCAVCDQMKAEMHETFTRIKRTIEESDAKFWKMFHETQRRLHDGDD